MQVQDYTEKSIVVFGDKTKEYKDGIKALGGKFNMKLSVGPGWVLPKTKKEEVEKYVVECLAGKVPEARQTEQKFEFKPQTTYNFKDNSKNMKINDLGDIDQGKLLKMIYEKLNEVTDLLKMIKTEKRMEKVDKKVKTKDVNEEYEEVEYEEEIVDLNPKKFKL
jgi:hypothetical protein